jgi:hypothetical protein
MPTGTRIELFLVEGSPSGLVTAGVGQWTGQAIVVPRAKLDSFSARPDAQRPGVYVLAGPDPEKADRERIYVGEGETVLDRLKSHVREKDFWTKACVFTSSDSSLTKAHVKYLESRLIQVGNERGRATMENAKASELPKLPEAHVSDMELFIERALVLLPVLGFDFTRPRAEVVAATTAESAKVPTFVFETKGAKALAREVEGQFVVLKGSTASSKPAESWKTYQEVYAQLKADGVLVPHASDTKLLLFTDDFPFDSPSAAGSIVSGNNVSGRQAWFVENTEQTYGQWQDAKIAASEAQAPASEVSPAAPASVAASASTSSPAPAPEAAPGNSPAAATPKISEPLQVK